MGGICSSREKVDSSSLTELERIYLKNAFYELANKNDM